MSPSAHFGLILTRTATRTTIRFPALSVIAFNALAWWGMASLVRYLWSLA